MAFKKGQSGNVKGRPKVDFRSDAIRSLTKAGLTDAILAEKIKQQIELGNETLLKVAAEYLWGKPIQRTENYNEHVFPTQIEVVLKNAKKDSQA